MYENKKKKKKGSGYYQNVYSATDFKSRNFWSKVTVLVENDLKLIKREHTLFAKLCNYTLSEHV